MKELEKFIDDNRQEFDREEPGLNHFDRFMDKLESQPAVRPAAGSRFALLRVAAVVLVLVMAGAIGFEMATRGLIDQLTGGTAELLPREINEAVDYYDRQAVVSRDTLNKLIASRDGGEEVRNSVDREIDDLDRNMAELKKALADNPGNEKILDAIVRNQQMKDAMLRTVISMIEKPLSK